MKPTRSLFIVLAFGLSACSSGKDERTSVRFADPTAASPIHNANAAGSQKVGTGTIYTTSTGSVFIEATLSPSESNARKWVAPDGSVWTKTIGYVDRESAMSSCAQIDRKLHLPSMQDYARLFGFFETEIKNEADLPAVGKVKAYGLTEKGKQDLDALFPDMVNRKYWTATLDRVQPKLGLVIDGGSVRYSDLERLSISYGLDEDFLDASQYVRCVDTTKVGAAPAPKEPGRLYSVVFPDGTPADPRTTVRIFAPDPASPTAVKAVGIVETNQADLRYDMSGTRSPGGALKVSSAYWALNCAATETNGDEVTTYRCISSSYGNDGKFGPQGEITLRKAPN